MSVAQRASAFGSFAVVLVGVIAAAWALRLQFELSAQFPLFVVMIFAAVMLLAIGAMGVTHPFEGFGPANQITTVRAGLVALVAGLLGEQPTPSLAAAAAATALTAAGLDGLDGWVARRTGSASAFGARFDLEIDALLIMALSLLAWQHEKAGAWILLSGLMRYLFIASGLLWVWLRQPLPASRRRQAICVAQIVGLIVAVVPIVRPPWSALVAAVSLAALCCSFLVDTVWLWRNAS